MYTQFPGEGEFISEGLWGGLQGPQINKDGLTIADLSGRTVKFGYYAEFLDIYLTGPSAGVNAGLNSKIIGVEARGRFTSAEWILKYPLFLRRRIWSSA